MDYVAQPCHALSFFLICTLFPLSFAYPQRHLLQSTPPQNIQTFFPSTAVPAFSTSPPPPSPSPSGFSSPSPPGKASSNRKIVTAVIATASSSFALSGLLFFAFLRFSVKRRLPEHRSDVPGPAPYSQHKPNPAVKGVIADDDGLDVLYWRSLDVGAPMRCEQCHKLFRESPNHEYSLPSAGESPSLPQKDNRSNQHIPLLPSGSVNSSSMTLSAQPRPSKADVERVPHTPTPPAPPPLPPHPQAKPTPSPSPPPPPPPAPLVKKSPAPPPIPPSRRSGPPPPVRRPGAPPPIPEGGPERPKMKPLHWDKITPANAGHSMVWDKITDGSIGFDDGLMEALFGYVATNRNSPQQNPRNNPAVSTSTGASVFSGAAQAQIRLLDPRKSQNIAIILRTLAVSRQEILDGLQDGHGLSADTLEKLSRITPTPEEESTILSFAGNPLHLADAESFLFHILRAVPSAFPRVAALHFRHSTYEPEIFHIRQSLQTLELACKELRGQQLFLKLLEAILKAGNRMNAGTARGNAQAFDLTALLKLSDVKSTDGRTTLLHFVVEEVVRSEGKSCATLNRSYSIRRSTSRNATEPEAHRQAREEREREYMMLGLPIVGGLSVDFTNVKRAAAIDHDSLVGGCAFLGERVAEIWQLLRSWKEEGEFVKEMTRFVEAAAAEIERVTEEQKRVMEMVRRTTEYYQPAASKDNPAQALQLFVIVRDFLSMVDQACVDITRKLQKKKQLPQLPAAKLAPIVASPSSSVDEETERPKIAKLPSLKEERITTRFPNLPARFLSDNSLSSDSEEEDEF